MIMTDSDSIQIDLMLAIKTISEASLRVARNGIESPIYRTEIMASLDNAIDMLRNVRANVYRFKTE